MLQFLFGNLEMKMFQRQKAATLLSYNPFVNLIEIWI